MVLLGLGVRPIEPGEVLVEPIGVVRNLEHPLAKRNALYGVRTALALAVDDLLVGKHRPERRAPVHGNIRLVGEPPLEKLEEDPLRPFHIRWIRCVDFPRPVVAEAQSLELALEGGNVVPGCVTRVSVGCNGVLLGRQAEGIPTHWVENIHASHSRKTGDDVSRRVPLRMANGQSGARRIREHIEHIEFLSTGSPIRAKALVLFPVPLPLRLDVRRHVALT